MCSWAAVNPDASAGDRAGDQRAGRPPLACAGPRQVESSALGCARSPPQGRSGAASTEVRATGSSEASRGAAAGAGTLARLVSKGPRGPASLAQWSSVLYLAHQAVRRLVLERAAPDERDPFPLHRRVPAGPDLGSVHRLHAHARRDRLLADRGRCRAPGDRAEPAGAAPGGRADQRRRQPAAAPARRRWRGLTELSSPRAMADPLHRSARAPARGGRRRRHGHQPVRARPRDRRIARAVEPGAARARARGAPELRRRRLGSHPDQQLRRQPLPPRACTARRRRSAS